MCVGPRGSALRGSFAPSVLHTLLYFRLVTDGQNNEIESGE